MLSNFVSPNVDNDKTRYRLSTPFLSRIMEWV